MDGWSHSRSGSEEEAAESDGVATAGTAKDEVRRVVQHMKDKGVKNVIFLSGDVRFPFALSYDPFKDGSPLFYELGCAPLASLCETPPIDDDGNVGLPHDTYFNPTVLYATSNLGPDATNFGTINVDDVGPHLSKIFLNVQQLEYHMQRTLLIWLFGSYNWFPDSKRCAMYRMASLNFIFETPRALKCMG